MEKHIWCSTVEEADIWICSKCGTARLKSWGLCPAQAAPCPPWKTESQSGFTVEKDLHEKVETHQNKLWEFDSVKAKLGRIQKVLDEDGYRSHGALLLDCLKWLEENVK